MRFLILIYQLSSNDINDTCLKNFTLFQFLQSQSYYSMYIAPAVMWGLSLYKGIPKFTSVSAQITSGPRLSVG